MATPWPDGKLTLNLYGRPPCRCVPPALHDVDAVCPSIPTITILGDDQQRLVDIYVGSGRVVIHNEDRLDEAAQAFWAAVRHWAPPPV